MLIFYRDRWKITKYKFYNFLPISALSFDGVAVFHVYIDNGEVLPYLCLQKCAWNLFLLVYDIIIIIIII